MTVRGGQLAVSDSDSEARTDGTMGGGLQGGRAMASWVMIANGRGNSYGPC